MNINVFCSTMYIKCPFKFFENNIKIRRVNCKEHIQTSVVQLIGFSWLNCLI